MRQSEHKILENVLALFTFRACGVVLGQAYRGLTGGFLLLRIFSVGISVSRHVCFILGLNFDFYVSKIMHL